MKPFFTCVCPSKEFSNEPGICTMCEADYKPAYFSKDLLKAIEDRKIKYASDDSPAIVRQELQALADQIKGDK